MNHATQSIRLIALFEATKGALVLLAGFGVLGVIHDGAEQVTEDLVRHFHLNPASRFPRIFLQVADHTKDSTLWLMALAAVTYSAMRFIEAFGLWRSRAWAKWFGIVSGAAYIPIEIYELLHGVTWIKATLLAVNSLCVICLVRALHWNERMDRMPRLSN